MDRSLHDVNPGIVIDPSVQILQNSAGFRGEKVAGIRRSAGGREGGFRGAVRR
jgi:hypothetical protein